MVAASLILICVLTRQNMKGDEQDLFYRMSYFPNFNKVKFKELPWRRLLKLISKTKQIILNDLETWRITKGRYTQERWCDIFESLIETPVENIELDSNFYTETLRNISTADYTNLIRLSITENKITTIEPLQLMSAPHLEVIDLSSNLITLIQPFRRSLFKKLKTYFFSSNYITDMPLMCRFGGRNLRKMYVELHCEQTNGETKSWVVKIDSQKIEEIHFLCPKRIACDNLDEMIKKKWSYVKLTNQKKNVTVSTTQLPQSISQASTRQNTKDPNEIYEEDEESWNPDQPIQKEEDEG